MWTIFLPAFVSSWNILGENFEKFSERTYNLSIQNNTQQETFKNVLWVLRKNNIKLTINHLHVQINFMEDNKCTKVFSKLFWKKWHHFQND